MSGASSNPTFRAAAAAVYRRFLRQIRAHPRHRVKSILFEEVRREFSIPTTPVSPVVPPASHNRPGIDRPAVTAAVAGNGGTGGGDEEAAVRARVLSRSLLAITWLKRAAADPLSSEGELLHTLVKQRDGMQKRKIKQKGKQAADAEEDEASERVLAALYEPLTDIIGVRGVAGAHWRSWR